jgi:hypothetical protein
VLLQRHADPGNVAGVPLEHRKSLLCTSAEPLSTCATASRRCRKPLVVDAHGAVGQADAEERVLVVCRRKRIEDVHSLGCIALATHHVPPLYALKPPGLEMLLALDIPQVNTVFAPG